MTLHEVSAMLGDTAAKLSDAGEPFDFVILVRNRHESYVAKTAAIDPVAAIVTHFRHPDVGRVERRFPKAGGAS